jgi:hypothetical protein
VPWLAGPTPHSTCGAGRLALGVVSVLDRPPVPTRGTVARRIVDQRSLARHLRSREPGRQPVHREPVGGAPSAPLSTALHGRSSESASSAWPSRRRPGGGHGNPVNGELHPLAKVSMGNYIAQVAEHRPGLAVRRHGLHLGDRRAPRRTDSTHIGDGRPSVGRYESRRTCNRWMVESVGRCPPAPAAVVAGKAKTRGTGVQEQDKDVLAALLEIEIARHPRLPCTTARDTEGKHWGQWKERRSSQPFWPRPSGYCHSCCHILLLVCY